MKKNEVPGWFFMALLVAVVCALALTGCTQERAGEPQRYEIDLPPPPPPPPQWSPVESLDEFSDDYLRAACRIIGGGSGGSGTCFKIDSDFVYVLTCSHVTGKTKNFTVEFWIDGRVTKYKGKLWKSLEVDASVVRVSIDQFKEGELPVAIPISLTPPDPSKPIVSVGSPGLGWQTLFEGHITKYPGGMVRLGAESFEFVPPPKGGRSGSAIIQDRKIVGVLWGATDERGFAVNCMDLQELVTKRGVFFTADWCVYCEEMDPIIATMDGITVIDYDTNASFAKMLGVKFLPAYVSRDGDVMYGVKNKKELEEFYE